MIKNFDEFINEAKVLIDIDTIYNNIHKEIGIDNDEDINIIHHPKYCDNIRDKARIGSWKNGYFVLLATAAERYKQENGNKLDTNKKELLDVYIKLLKDTSITNETGQRYFMFNDGHGMDIGMTLKQLIPWYAKLWLINGSSNSVNYSLTKKLVEYELETNQNLTSPGRNKLNKMLREFLQQPANEWDDITVTNDDFIIEFTIDFTLKDNPDFDKVKKTSIDIRKILK